MGSGLRTRGGGGGRRAKRKGDGKAKEVFHLPLP